MKKYFKYLLILLMFVATPVLAASDSLYQADNKLVVDKNLAGSAFLAGNEVSSTGEVDGILFLAGMTADVRSTSDYAFLAGETVNIKEASFKDGFIAGRKINIESSNIKRDIYVAGEEITIKSDIGRNAKVAGNSVVIDGVINGDIDISADSITINSNTVIKGKLTYTYSKELNISKDAVINEKSGKKVNNVKVSKEVDIAKKVYNSLFGFAATVVLALALLYFAKKVFERIDKETAGSVITNLGVGLLSFFAIPLLCIILLCTGVGVYLSLFLIALFVLMICLSTIVASYYIGNLLFKNKIKNKYLLMVVSLLIVYVVRLIPFVSGLLDLALLCIGLGISVKLIIKRK